MQEVIKLTKEQKNEVNKKISDLLEVCQIYSLPMFVAVVSENLDGKTSYINHIYSAKAHDIDLFDDQIEEHIKIANHFKAVPKREVTELDMDFVADIL